jgi:hypothetical protein
MVVFSADLTNHRETVFHFPKEESMLFRAFICRAKNVKANTGQLLRAQMCFARNNIGSDDPYIP